MNHCLNSMILLLLFASCGSKKDQEVSERSGPQLYIQTTTATGVGEDHVFDSTTVVDSEIFEVTLSVMGEGIATYYIGTKDLGAEASAGHLKFFNIVEKNDSIVKFNGSEEFMKYMSDRGYKMVSETRGEFANSYVFRRN